MANKIRQYGGALMIMALAFLLTSVGGAERPRDLKASKNSTGELWQESTETAGPERSVGTRSTIDDERRVATRSRSENDERRVATGSRSENDERRVATGSRSVEDETATRWTSEADDDEVATRGSSEADEVSEMMRTSAADDEETMQTSEADEVSETMRTSAADEDEVATRGSSDIEQEESAAAMDESHGGEAKEGTIVNIDTHALPAVEYPASAHQAHQGEIEVSRHEEEEPEIGLGQAEEPLLVWALSGRKRASYPRAMGEVSPEIEYNDYFAATVPQDERNNWLANVHFDQVLALSPNLTIDSRLRLVLNSDGEDLRFYSDFPHEGVYLTRLRAQYSREHWAAFAGKYEPAADIRGHGAIFFGNYSRDLDLDGRLGGGASITLGNKQTGKHTLSGHLFRGDRSRIRGEIWSDRWREDEHLEGTGPPGVGYLVTLHGTTVDRDIRLRYTLGAGTQKRGNLPEEDIAFAALFAELPLGDTADLEFSLDAMTLHGAGGYEENKRMVGPSAALSIADFSLGSTYTLRRVYDRTENTARIDHIAELVGRYSISQRTSLEGAYQHILERGNHENALGVVLQYSTDWLIH